MSMRVYEFAKLHNISSRDLVALLQELGYPVETHMVVMPEGSTEPAERALRAKASQQSSSVGQKFSGKKPSSGYVHKNSPISSSRHQPSRAVQEEQEDQAQRKAVPCRSMTVADFAAYTGQPLNEIIMALLRQGTALTRNQMLSEELVVKLTALYGLECEKIAAQATKPLGEAADASLSVGEVRQPIVVVMGHVDHGKTTLLDTIRKTRVASREKGGITQHLGAYEAVTPHGKITFLDTPGHAAFSMIRVRGAHIADIAILVVALDDGIKPQTVEAIDAAREAGIPVIVALNKVDRVTPAQIEVVKQALSQRGLVAEDWGGDVSMVPLSAKSGQGVDALLDMIALQAQVMELSAPLDVQGKGFVIESTVERGLGPVGTVILRRGRLRLGDYFVAGDTEGRVTALIDAEGKRVKEILPSMPALVAGFEKLPQAGDELTQVDSVGHRAASARTDRVDRTKSKSHFSGEANRENEFLILVKADSVSSLEALERSLAKTAKNMRSVVILHQGVGSISESDISLAAGAGAIIYGLHVKWEPRAQEFAQKNKVQVRIFDIIYRLLDDIALEVQPKKKMEFVTKKIGEAVVLKVFDIKKMGIVAGAIVKTGLFSKDGKVKVFRSKRPVGEGSIKSLQRDRRSVKEVHSGFECAFLVDGFSEWQEGDVVECYVQTQIEV